jgi:hypothetical protein
VIDARFAAALDALSEHADGADEFALVRAQEMLLGYHTMWCDEPYEVLGVEQQLFAPLVNPESGRPSRTWQLGGKLDVIVRDGRTGLTYKVEHKTSSEKIGPGSDYWLRLTLNPQVSTYNTLASEAGFDVSGCLYDVLGKPKLRPYKATPVADRKYVQKTGALYASQREADETPAEYALRVREAIAEHPDDFYQRGTIVRLESEEREAAQDRWQVGEQIRAAQLSGCHPRNPDACERYRTMCQFFDVCTGTVALDDETRFVRVDNVHQELDLSALDAADGRRHLAVLTNSQMSAFRRCQREHDLAYNRGYRAVHQGEALRDGTLVHYGLEGWWRAAMQAQLSHVAV